MVVVSERRTDGMHTPRGVLAEVAFSRRGRVLPLIVLMASLLRSNVFADGTNEAKLFGGMAFGAYGPDQSPWGEAPSTDQIRRRLEIAAKLTTSIRTYGTQENFDQIPRLCKELGIRCYPGAWVDKNKEGTELQIERLISIGKMGFPTTQALMVGNEAVHFNYLPKAELLAYLQRVKKETGMKVGTAEPAYVWLSGSNQDLVNAVDVLFVHCNPYWDGVSAASAAKHVESQMMQVIAKFPNKEVRLGEYSWPTAGSIRGAAVPSEENQLLVLRAMTEVIAKHGWKDAMLVETFDEAWMKTQQGEVGGHWGVYDQFAVPKRPLRELMEERTKKK